MGDCPHRRKGIQSLQSGHKISQCMNVHRRGQRPLASWTPFRHPVRRTRDTVCLRTTAAAPHRQRRHRSDGARHSSYLDCRRVGVKLRARAVYRPGRHKARAGVHAEVRGAERGQRSGQRAGGIGRTPPELAGRGPETDFGGLGLEALGEGFSEGCQGARGRQGQTAP